MMIGALGGPPNSCCEPLGLSGFSSVLSPHPSAPSKQSISTTVLTMSNVLENDSPSNSGAAL